MSPRAVSSAPLRLSITRIREGRFILLILRIYTYVERTGLYDGESREGCGCVCGWRVAPWGGALGALGLPATFLSGVGNSSDLDESRGLLPFDLRPLAKVRGWREGGVCVD